MEEEEIRVGDIVFIKDDLIERCRKWEIFIWAKQIAESKDVPFTVISTTEPYRLSLLNNNFGTDQQLWRGKLVAYSLFRRHEIEKRNGNQISLYELNKGL